MSRLLKAPPAGGDRDGHQDPFFYGFRHVERTLPDGSREFDQVPLTEEDILYPQEDDHISQKPPHVDDIEYLHGSLKIRYRGRADVAALADCAIDWGIPGQRAPCPDITVVFGVRAWRKQATYLVKQEGGRTVLLMEVTSPSTYRTDIETKPDIYYRAGVDCFVTVDRGPKGEDPVRLHVRHWSPDGWIDVSPDAQGRYELGPVGLRIGIEDGRVWLYDAATGVRLPDASELQAARDDAEARAEKAQAQAEAEAQARAAAQAQAEAEARARAAAQAQAEAEAQARAAAEARAEEARRQAEAAARARAELEERLRRLEEQL